MICKLLLTTAILMIPILAFAQNYQIDWYVIASGGGGSSSSNYSVDGTIGQAVDIKCSKL